MSTLRSENRPLAISIAEASMLLGLSRRSIENYIAAKKIVARKAGSRRLVLRSSLETFLRHDQPSPKPRRVEGTEIAGAV